MIHQTELRDLLPGMVPFPTDVFPADQAWLGQHLLPLLKIDLGLLRPELAGQVATMLCPIEPYDGCIGETEEHHNEFTGTNWIAFELTAGNEMRFRQRGLFHRRPGAGQARAGTHRADARAIGVTTMPPMVASPATRASARASPASAITWIRWGTDRFRQLDRDRRDSCSLRTGLHRGGR